MYAAVREGKQKPGVADRAAPYHQGRGNPDHQRVPGLRPITHSRRKPVTLSAHADGLLTTHRLSWS